MLVQFGDVINYSWCWYIWRCSPCNPIQLALIQCGEGLPVIHYSWCWYSVATFSLYFITAGDTIVWRRSPCTSLSLVLEQSGGSPGLPVLHYSCYYYSEATISLFFTMLMSVQCSNHLPVIHYTWFQYSVATVTLFFTTATASLQCTTAEYFIV